jgi:hypothetical protein
MKKWEKAASAGVSLVAEAAEQLERAAAEELEQVGSALQLSGQCTTNDMEQETPEDLSKLGSRETTEGAVSKSLSFIYTRNPVDCFQTDNSFLIWVKPWGVLVKKKRKHQS